MMLKDIKDNNNNYVSIRGIVRWVMEKGNYLCVSICDGTENLNNDKHYNISIRLNDRDIDKCLISFVDLYKKLKEIQKG